MRNMSFYVSIKSKKSKPISEFGFACFGGDEEDRTLDLTDANRTLSQLSYAPMYFYCQMIITN